MDDCGLPTAALLDPHPLWLESVERVLERAGVHVVARTTSACRALELARERQPNVLVAELDLGPGVEGATLIRQACELVRTMKVIVLSAIVDPAAVESALSAGAFAYVLKTADQGDLATAVRQAFQPSIFLPGPQRDLDLRPASVPGRPGTLTRRELEILRLAAEGRTNAELARMLWVTEKTVKFHLSNVYRKLGVSNRVQASRWAESNGILDSLDREAVAQTAR